MIRVKDRNNQRIIKDGRAFFKADIMLFEIAKRFFIVPFKFWSFHAMTFLNYTACQ